MQNLIAKTEILRRRFFTHTAKIPDMKNVLYPSSHFFERMVERNLGDYIDDVFIASCTAYKFFKNTSFNTRTVSVSIRGKKVCFKICIGKYSNKRTLVMQTIFDIDDPRCYADEDLSVIRN